MRAGRDYTGERREREETKVKNKLGLIAIVSMSTLGMLVGNHGRRELSIASAKLAARWFDRVLVRAKSPGSRGADNYCGSPPRNVPKPRVSYTRLGPSIALTLIVPFLVLRAILPTF